MIAIMPTKIRTIAKGIIAVMVNEVSKSNPKSQWNIATGTAITSDVIQKDVASGLGRIR
jgi:hypothetical protein